MTTGITDFQQSISPTAADTELARKSSQQLSRFLAQTVSGAECHSIQLHVPGNEHTEEIVMIPWSALCLLSDVLTHMAAGHAVTLLPIHTELTTQQAADILHVSRPFLISLIEAGKIPHRKVGTHRRIQFDDLIAYKQDIDKQRLHTLEELAQEAQDLGMGY